MVVRARTWSLLAACVIAGCAVGSTDTPADDARPPDPVDANRDAARVDSAPVPPSDGSRTDSRASIDATPPGRDALTANDGMVALPIDATVADVARAADALVSPAADVVTPRDVPVAIDAPVAIDVMAAPDVNVSRDAGYTVTEPSPRAWIDACGARGSQHVLATVDEGVSAASLPFAFTFWNVPYVSGSDVTISSNGWMALVATDDPAMSGSLPGTDAPDATIAAVWDDLYLGGFTSSAVCTVVAGSAPSRTYVVEWLDAKYLDAGARLTFEIVLAETTNTIDLRYQRMDGARASLIGLESPDGLHAISPCGTGTSCVISTRSFRFTPW